jgi:hypothetical protein
MKKEAATLIKYVKADFSERMFLFLQNPDLRDAFQQIERTYLAPRIGCRPFLYTADTVVELEISLKAHREGS